MKATCPDCVVHVAYAGTSPDAFRIRPRARRSRSRRSPQARTSSTTRPAPTGHGVFEAAHDAHVFAIGVDADQHDEMPGTVVTSMVKRGDVAVFDTIRAATEHKFVGGMHVFGVKDGAIDYVHEGPHAAAYPRCGQGGGRPAEAGDRGRQNRRPLGVANHRDSTTLALPNGGVMALVHGGRLVAQALKRHGTTHLFTLCGGHIQAIYDGCIDEGIRVVDVRHEQTAGHAADGYARVTGKPGVCAVTAGPGVTDVVTARRQRAARAASR